MLPEGGRFRKNQPPAWGLAHGFRWQNPILDRKEGKYPSRGGGYLRLRLRSDLQRKQSIHGLTNLLRQVRRNCITNLNELLGPCSFEEIVVREGLQAGRFAYCQ
jgi:hypothetical protein